MGTDSLRLDTIGQASLTSALATGTQGDSYRVSLIVDANYLGGTIADEHLTTGEAQSAKVSTTTITTQTGGSQETVTNVYNQEVARSTYDAYYEMKMRQVEEASGGYVPPPYVPPRPPPPPPVYKPPPQGDRRYGGPQE